MTNNPTTRRRFLTAAAALSGAAALWRYGASRKTEPAAHEDTPFVWQGIALGSEAELRIYGTDRKTAEMLVGKVLAEVARLEKIFSLYRDDSLISRLNREGRLNRPPADLLSLLSLSGGIWRETQGAFDPTVQPLWNLYADHFRRHPRAETPPPKSAVDNALKRVGFDKLRFDDTAVSFAGQGMGLSLNGIAQGYITDKVIGLLAKNGIRRVLADIGEIRALDTDKRGTWRVGIRHPDDENRVLLTVPLQNGAFATSGGYGTVLDEAGRFTHLFDPRTGGSTPRYKSISVQTETAAVADALSTAFSVMDETGIRNVCRHYRARAWLVMPDGSVKTQNG